MSTLQETIEAAWEQRASYTPQDTPAGIRQAVAEAIDALDDGRERVAEKIGGAWRVNEWLKKAVLLSFRIEDNKLLEMGALRGWDKVPLKYSGYDEHAFRHAGARIVPPAIVRRGAYVSPDAVLMPSYVNIGAWIGPGTMVDTWATVGSCAQVGANVHISGGAGIGGVLEPLQSSPTIIEDNCFIGARSEVVEGVVIEEGAVLSMGVFIGQSTRIYDRERDEISYGRVPAGAVVVPGSLPSSEGHCHLACAVIVKRVDAATRAKVGINELLRAAR
jgi:2,3,4,5-tetrahydropyridine-2,6-dicarboxylate N-succinyltransferase